MNRDWITKIVMKDILILQLGQVIFRKLKKRRNYSYIKQRMRQCARVLMEAQERNGTIANFEQLIHPDHFDLLVQSVRRLSKYDEQTRLYGVCGLPFKLGQNFTKCAQILLSNALKHSDIGQQKSCHEFLKLMQVEYAAISTQTVSSFGRKRINSQKYHEPINTIKFFPIIRDITKLSNYISAQLSICSEELEKNCSTESYTKFAQLLLASIWLFNRRRKCDMLMVTIEDFHKENKANVSTITEKIGCIEIALLNDLRRVQYLDKNGKEATILLRATHISFIEFLINYRASVGFLANNPYIFAAVPMTSKTAMNSCFILRKITTEAELDKPELMRSTILRKLICTLSQLTVLSPDELQQLTNYMSQNFNVHVNCCDLSRDIVQLSKVGQLLMSAENGKFQKGDSRTLENLNFNDDIMAIVDNFDDSVTDNVSSNKDNTVFHTNPSFHTELIPDEEFLINGFMNELMNAEDVTIQNKEILNSQNLVSESDRICESDALQFDHACKAGP